MASRKKADGGGERLQPWEETLFSILGALLTFLLHTTRSNPAEPAAADALRQLTAMYEQLRRRAGADDAPLSDPHGLLGTSRDKPEGK